MASLQPKILSRPSSPSKSSQPRPKAKVNTSAAFGSRKLPSQSSTTPRAPSPFKHSSYQSLTPRIYPSTSSSTLSPSSRPNPPHPSHSTPTSPDSKPRRPSLIVHHSKSSVSLAARAAAPSPLTIPSSPFDLHTNGAGSSSPLRNAHNPSRVTSKVTRIVKSASQLGSPSSAPSLPSNVPSRVPFMRPRVPSVSNISMFSSSPSSQPSSSGLPTATRHKRAISYTKMGPIYQAFPVDNDQTIHHNIYTNKGGNGVSPVTKVDPALIPLPIPYSPPTSNVSFSSHSSKSSATSYNTHYSARSGSPGHAFTKSQSNGTISIYGGDPSPQTVYNKSRGGSPVSGDEGPDDQRIKAEAKSIRKIADLEITNRSLMAINATLEAAKHRQAKEIRILRRKLRESRLILPPKTFLQVESASDRDETSDEDDENNETEGDQRGDTDFKDDKDEMFKRVRTILDGLLDQGQRALAAKPYDFGEGSATKVLHAEELRSWGGSDEEGNMRISSTTDTAQDDSDDYEIFAGRRHGENSEIDMTLRDSDSSSEREVEGMVSIKITPS